MRRFSLPVRAEEGPLGFVSVETEPGFFDGRQEVVWILNS
jgi:hypothetical protein